MATVSALMVLVGIVVSVGGGAVSEGCRAESDGVVTMAAVGVRGPGV
jgi:hypothetical protein